MIIHVTADWNRRAGDHRRHRDAAASWPRAFRGVEYRHVAVHEESLKRNAKTVLGDGKPLPFIRELLDAAIERAYAKDGEILFFCNDDCGLAEGLGELIEHKPFSYGSRKDFISIPRRVTFDSVSKGHSHGGMDIFSMQVEMWPEVRRQMPDMLLCREAWDLVMKRILKDLGAVELLNCAAHQMHLQEWTTAWDHPSSKHNNKLAQEFAESKGVTEIKFV